MDVRFNNVPADLVLLNGKVISVDSNNTIAEAIAITDNKISSVGKTEEIKKLIHGDTHVIDLEGKSILPGFIDAHTHAEWLAVSRKYQLQAHAPPLKSTKDVSEIVKNKVKNTPKGEWIVCRGSFHSDHKYEEKRFPSKEEFDAVSPDHPVVFFSGMHLSILNSKALSVAGITSETPTYVKRSGLIAEVDKDPETGEPTGIIREGLKILPLPRYNEKDIESALKEILFRDFIQQGITSIHDMPGSEAFQIYQKWILNDSQPLRVQAYFFMPQYGGDIDPLVTFGFQSGFGNEWLKLGGIKLIVDGGGSSGSASLYQPYPNNVHNFGILNYSQEELTEIYSKAHKAGFQILAHTIGERAQDMVMNAIEAALFELPKKDHRHRLEHAGNCFATPERMERMLELGAIPSVNPQFIHATGFLLEHTFGKRAKKGFYPFRMLLDMGFNLPFSSDCTGTQPEGTNPFWGIWCAVKRETFDGSVLNQEQKISVLEAIKCYTIYAAMAGFEEIIKGSIEPGKLADLIVLSADPLTVAVDQLKEIKVNMTIIDGKIAYAQEH